MDTVDLRAAEVARAQYGRATRLQLRGEAGISASTLRRRLDAGVWVEGPPGVIDLRLQPDSWRGRVTGLVLAGGASAWASHATAAHLHRFLDAPRPEAIDVLVPRTRHRLVGGDRLHGTRHIGADEVTERRRIPCTTRARTLLDLAATTAPDQLER